MLLQSLCLLPSAHPSLQDFHSLATYLSQNTSSVFLDTVSDFHLLLFLVTNEVMPLQVWPCACPLGTWCPRSPGCELYGCVLCSRTRAVVTDPARPVAVTLHKGGACWSTDGHFCVECLH